jgi:hypothetical protein
LPLISFNDLFLHILKYDALALAGFRAAAHRSRSTGLKQLPVGFTRFLIGCYSRPRTARSASEKGYLFEFAHALGKPFSNIDPNKTPHSACPSPKIKGEGD